MTAELLNVLVGAAVTDRDFCQDLLNDPGHAARRFGLEPEAVEALSGIRARSLSEFAGQLMNWMPRDARGMSYAAAG